jgi:serine/threonine-protein kinase
VSSLTAHHQIEDTMPPAVGVRFSRYELVSKLGAGGMGEVWRAHDHELHRDVAIKFLPERWAVDANRMGRFVLEARAASSLNHPNIITIHEIGRAEGSPYIVMELVEGRTLRSLIDAANRPLAPRQMLDIGVQIADGLAKAHGAGITHRDLKPENVMVTAEGFVKILDFGLAKLHDVGSDDTVTGPRPGSEAPTRPTGWTASGVVMGTVGYMAPEQARGQPVDHRADQFNLGAILYEMASGRQAFRRETPVQTVAAIIEDPPEPLALLNPALPPPLRWLIERCLAKEPDERYASTLDLARDLRSLREHLSEVPSTPSSAAPAPRARWMSPRVAVLGVVALILIAVAARYGPAALEWTTVQLGLRAVPAEKHIAVLPFRTSAVDGDERVLAEGLTELLAVRLAQLEPLQSSLWVEPASNVFQSGATSAAQAARALGVTLAVTGSVHRVEEKLLLTAALEDARLDRVLRAVTADSPEALVEGVVGMLELELGKQADAALRGSRTGVAEAATLASQGLGYTPYAEGRTALERYEQQRSLERAVGSFNQALERDPGYALAHAGLGEAYWRLYRLTRRDEYVALARQHCQRALAIDDTLAPAWVTLGVLETGSGQAEAGVAAFRKALDRDPRNADAYRELGLAYERAGRLDEAEATYRKAIELRPDSWAGYSYLGYLLITRGRSQEAESAYDRALRIAPDNSRLWSSLGAARFYQGRFEEAKRAFRRSLELNPTPQVASNLATLEFRDGRFAEAARTLAAAAAGTRDYRVWRNLAAAYWWSPGERAKAKDACATALDLGRKELELSPGDAALLVALADCHGMRDQKDEARRLAAQALGVPGVNVPLLFEAGMVYEDLGDRDQALELIARALRGGYPISDVELHPGLRGLRADPRFEALRAELAAGNHRSANQGGGI